MLHYLHVLHLQIRVCSSSLRCYAMLSILSFTVFMQLGRSRIEYIGREIDTLHGYHPEALLRDVVELGFLCNLSAKARNLGRYWPVTTQDEGVSKCFLRFFSF